jgi:membrane protein YdbS with pleckstrin-like domain
MLIDIQEPLMNTIQPSKVLIVLLASCLFWIGGISLAVMWFAGSSVTAGWIVAGALVLAVLVWLAVMSHEIRHAMELRIAVDRSGKNADNR